MEVKNDYLCIPVINIKLSPEEAKELLYFLKYANVDHKYIVDSKIEIIDYSEVVENLIKELSEVVNESKN